MQDISYKLRVTSRMFNNLSYYRKYVSIVILLVTSNWQLATAQDFVKKDSSDFVPFIAKKYYADNIDIEQSSPIKMNSIHRLSSRISSNNEFATQGNFGSALIPILYENKFYKNLNLGRNLTDNYFYNSSNIPYYALNKPFSELDFIFFGNGNEEFNGVLSQNLSKNFNIGIGIRRSNNLGYFINQANLHNNFYVSAVYQSKQWRSNFEIVFNEVNLKENGGLVNDIYRTNLTSGLWKSENPILNIAKNEIYNFKIAWRNRWLIASQTNSSDSLLFVPIKSALYIDNDFSFNADRINYHDTISRDNQTIFYRDFANKNYREFKSIYHNEAIQNIFALNYSINNFTLKAYSLLVLNNLYQRKFFAENNILEPNFNISLGFSLNYKINNQISYIGEVYKSFTGYTEEDFFINNQFTTQFKDWNINLISNYSHQLPAYSYNYVFNSAVDTFQNLLTQKTWENGFEIKSKKYRLNLKAQYFLINDFLTFDTLSRPIQLHNNFYQLSIQKEWGWKSLYFPTLIMYQNSIFHRGLIRQTLAYKNKLFSDKNNIIFGVDLSLNYDNVEPRYNPLLMQQLYSETMLNSKIYPKVDLFATFKISRVHVSLIMDNFLSTYLKTGYSATVNNPITPSAFYFRANWVFLE